MRFNIPPTLKWLSSNLSKLKGERERVEQEYSRFLEESEARRKQLQERLDVIEADIEAFGRVLRMHEIPIDPNKIGSIIVHTNGRHTGYGGMTKLVLGLLRTCRGESLTTSQIAIYVANHSKVSVESEEFVRLRLNVRHRLKAMANDKKIARLHSPRGVCEGRWKACD